MFWLVVRINADGNPNVSLPTELYLQRIVPLKFYEHIYQIPKASPHNRPANDNEASR